MSLSRLWTFLAVALPVLASLLAAMSTVDLTYHLRAGREILETGRIPAVDAWTFTVAGQPWFDQQWGAQVVLRLAEALGSWTGLAVLRALATGIVVGCLLVVARRRGLSPRTAAVVVLAAFVVAAPAMALRPQLLGMAAFAVVLLLVTERRARPRALWLVPLVVVAWANLHGSFFLGPLLLGLAWLEDLHDRVPRPHATLGIAVVAALAACLTPSGPYVWAYVATLSSDPEVTARVTEWRPTTLLEPAGAVFFASAVAVAVLAARAGRRPPWPTIAWLAVFFGIGLIALRGVAWWPMAAVPVVAGLLRPGIAPRPLPERAGMRRLNLAVAGVLVLAMVALLPVWRPIDPGTGTPTGMLADAPSGITAALRDLARPGDRVLTAQVWGSWLEYAMPDVTVAVDSRIELFPPDVWRDFEAAVTGDAGIAERWRVDFVVLSDPDDPAVTAYLAHGWDLRAIDADGAILGHDR